MREYFCPEADGFQSLNKIQMCFYRPEWKPQKLLNLKLNLYEDCGFLNWL